MKKINITKLLLVGIVLAGVTSCKPDVGNSSSEVPVSSSQQGGESHEHALTKEAEKLATCTRDGYEAYYVCDCGKMFSDMNAENEIYSPVLIPKADHTPTKTEAKESTCIVQGHDAYWTCNFCYKMFSDENCEHEITSLVKKDLANHDVTKVDAKEPGAITAGNIEHYRCNDCGELYSDANATTKITVKDIYHGEGTSGMTWKPMADNSNPTELGYENGEITFTGLGSSYYMDNVFVTENNEEIVGPYSSKTANTEYTYSLDVSSTGTFALVLYCDEKVEMTYDEDDIHSGVAEQLGFYLRFDSEDTETNVKIQAALGNGTSSKEADTGIKAKGNSTFKFDGTKNSVKVRLERFSIDKIIFHISINGEEISWKKTNSSGVDYTGFNLRDTWIRTDLVNGIGEKAYIKTAIAYPTLACSRRLSETEGFASGLGVAVLGRLDENKTVPTGFVGDTSENVVVKISNMTRQKTGEQVVA